MSIVIIIIHLLNSTALLEKLWDTFLLAIRKRSIRILFCYATMLWLSDIMTRTYCWWKECWQRKWTDGRSRAWLQTLHFWFWKIFALKQTSTNIAGTTKRHFRTHKHINTKLFKTLSKYMQIKNFFFIQRIVHSLVSFSSDMLIINALFISGLSTRNIYHWFDS